MDIGQGGENPHQVKRAVVFGGRDFADITFKEPKDRDLVIREHRFLMQSLEEYATSQLWRLHIISGVARGVDTVAIAFAKLHSLPYEEHPITRDDWRKFKNAAGPMRNQSMIDQGKPDVGIMFPGGNGTRDMCNRLTKAGIPVIDYTEVWKFHN